MRIDKYLKVSRIIKRRTVAQQACQAGRIQINGKVAKPSAQVKPGDIIAIEFRNQVTSYEVLSIENPRRVEDAAQMVRVR